MTTPESKQWPPSLPDNTVSADAWLQMFEATRHAVETTQRVCRKALKEMGQNDLIFEIYESNNPKTPYKVAHGLRRPMENIHSPQKILWVPNAVSIDIIRKNISKDTRQNLARLLYYTYAAECWEERKKEDGESAFSMQTREQYQEPEFLAYAEKKRDIQPLYETLFTGRMKKGDAHLFTADSYI